MFFDRKLDASLEAVATASAEAAAGGGDIGAGDDDLTGEEGDDQAEGGDDLEGGEADLGGAEGDDAATDDDSVLLSTPGSRNQPYLTPKSKGKKYTRVNYDGRKNKRQQNMNGQMAREKGKNTQRNVFPGLSDLSSLAKGIYEQKETTYIAEENSILKNNEEINQIIEVLNKKDNNNDKV